MALKKSNKVKSSKKPAKKTAAKPARKKNAPGRKSGKAVPSAETIVDADEDIDGFDIDAIAIDDESDSDVPPAQIDIDNLVGILHIKDLLGVREDTYSLSEIIKKYDDRGLVSQGEIPGVLIRADLKCMSQVIGNIISNSYKYAGTDIEVSCRLVDEYLEMKLKDHGPGVPADELALITNKFYRGKQWAESKEEGSGLGLYIAKRLMEKMDGELLPESPGDGFCITLLIPLS